MRALVFHQNTLTLEQSYQKPDPQPGEAHCPNRTTLGIVNRDGAFAEYLTLPIANLHLVPDNIVVRYRCSMVRLAHDSTKGRVKDPVIPIQRCFRGYLHSKR